MADYDWRNLERLYYAGDVSILPRLNAARKRVGLPQIRLRIIHYLKADYAHAVGNDGWLDARVLPYGAWSICGSISISPQSREDRRKKRLCPYTLDKDQVTCKTCLRCLRSPKFREGKPALHRLMRLPSGHTRTRCGGKYGRSTEEPSEVGCHGCKLIVSGKPRTRGGHHMNARGRRRLRRQKMFVS